MIKQFFFVLVFSFGIPFCFAQEDEKKESPKDTVQNPVDSLRTDLKRKGVTVDAVSFEKKPINPLAPSKAAFYSAVIPGLGQVYNKRYWKVPIVYGALGTSIYVYSFNNTEYNRFRNAFKRRRAGFTDDEFFDINGDGNPNGMADVSDAALEDAQERFQRDRDLALLITIVLYALNVIDANVDAHLKQYNVDEDLVLDIKPYLDLNPIDSNPNYGLTMIVKF
ncbi:DUF5683 domain-containing protein [Allomuricauda sp. d1]|uniref:DUF5683 domain-containing protein n=1 Tax=Allomuricauda sp. d1 TaxID=3136725 RepID=UPI0031D3CFD0